MFSSRYIKRTEALLQSARDLIDTQQASIKTLQDQNIRLAGEVFQLSNQLAAGGLSKMQVDSLATLSSAAVQAFNSSRTALGEAIEAQALKLAGQPATAAK